MSGVFRNRTLLRWVIICIAAWTAFAILLQVWADLTALYEGRHPAVLSNFVTSLGQMYTLGLFSPVFIWAVHTFPPTRRPAIATLGVYFATLIGVLAVGLPLFALVSNYLLGRHFTLETTLEEGGFTLLLYAVVLTIVVAITQLQIANDRAASALRLEAALSKLRVEALQRQLHPHFIFNTLNAVSALMRTDVNSAEEMIAALGDLLRTATSKSNTPMVPLREELSLLDRYALIMKMRYGDRLAVRITAEPRALEIPFPTFTLQPLVENAIVHGLEKTHGGITVEIVCRVDSDTLVVEINDDGAAPEMTTLQEGVGIGNTRARLAELYGKRASISIAPGQSQGTRFTLAVPMVPSL
jgi:two-component system, LytTR family, sensor kinase